jgi:hypothetical protein
MSSSGIPEPSASGSDWMKACELTLYEPNSCKVGGLLSNREYRMRVRQKCYDARSDSTYLDHDGCQTSIQRAHPPQNVQAVVATPYEFQVLWTPGNDPHACLGLFVAWEVQALRADEEWPLNETSTALGCRTSSRETTNCTITTGLIGSDTAYQVRVREVCTENEIGSDWAYRDGINTPAPQRADYVQNMTTHFDKEPFSVTISWTAGHPGDCVFDSWHVEVAVSQTDKTSDKVWVKQPHCSQSCVVRRIAQCP